MKVETSVWIDSFNKLALRAGACAWGITQAHELDESLTETMTRWVKQGCNAGMGYLERHIPLKKSLESVLPGCKSVVSFAFPYFSSKKSSKDAYIFSRHSRGSDYHAELKKRLKSLSDFIKDDFGARTRICVDSAPVAERYWATQCGIGSIGRNGLLYVPGFGSWVFLAEIFSTEILPEKKGNEPLLLKECEECSKCIDACPGHAISHNHTINSNHCRSYLTIENRDEKLPDGINLGRRIFGCDICQESCPLNNVDIPESTWFEPKNEFLGLTPDKIQTMNDEQFRKLSCGTALERITLWQFKRNAGLSADLPQIPQ